MSQKRPSKEFYVIWCMVYKCISYLKSTCEGSFHFSKIENGGARSGEQIGQLISAMLQYAREHFIVMADLAHP
jgi:hypothetical protein